MEIGIVGAGIAGLAAATALGRAGHDVEIFEKSSFKREIGAAILLTPNGNRILRRWGFDFDKARPVDFKQFRFLNAKTLQVAIRDTFKGVEEKFGERMCAYNRVDLHLGLRELAEKQDVKIRLGAEVVDVEPEEGVVEIAGGEKVQKDFWILADGCHCPFLPKIAQENIPTVKTGKSVYRWLAPFDKVKQHPDAAKLWDNEGAGFCTFFNDKITMVTYPCHGQELLNCAVFHDTRPEERDKEDWNANTTHEKVLEAMEGMHEAIRNIPMTAEQMKVYTVTQRSPSTRIYRGKMLCIGDTTHHMLPTHAQGGCSALEDAAALEVIFNTSIFPSPSTPATLQKHLKIYQQLRLPRSATTQILSSTNPRFTLENLAKKTAEIRRFYQGDLPDWPMGVQSWSEPIRDFFYGYDAFAEAEKALGFVEVGELPRGWQWFGAVKEGVRMEGAGIV